MLLTLLCLAVAVLGFLLLRQHALWREAEQKRQRAERFLGGVMGLESLFLAVLSPDGRVLEISETVTGGDLEPQRERSVIPRDRVLGQLFWDIYWFDHSPHARAEWPGRLRQAAQVRSAVTFIDGYTGLRGHFRHVKAELTAVRDAADAVKFFVLYTTDVTTALRVEADLRETHVKLEAQAQQLTTTLESIAQGIFMIGADGRLSTFNPQVCELLNLPAEYLRTGPSLQEITRYQSSRGDFGEDAVLVKGLARSYVASGALGDVPERYLRTRTDGRVLEVRTNTLSAGGMVRTFADVTGYIRAEEAARASEEVLRQITAKVPGMVYRLVIASDGKRHYSFVSEGARDLYGIEPEQALNDPQIFFKFWHPEEREALQAHTDQAVAERGPLSYDFRIVLADGTEKWVQMNSSAVTNSAEGSVRNGVIVDITARKKVESELREQDATWKLALESTGDGVWDWNIQSGAETVSTRCLEIYGYEASDIAPTIQALDAITHPEDIERMQADRQAHFDGVTPAYINEHRLHCKDGSWKWILSRGMVISRDAQGKPLRMIGTHTDISSQKQAQALIWSQANFDTLTQLPNRHMLRDRLVQDMKRAQREGSKLAVLFMDLDHFKEVNDTLGHPQGDALLVQAASRISACVRATDTVARLGGDEFTVLVPLRADLTRVDAVVDTLLGTLSKPFVLGSEHAVVSVSIGIAIFPDDATDIDDLLKRADQALYLSKDTGRNRASYFTPALQQAATLRARLTGDLRVALELEQLWVAYQPIVDLRTGAVTKAEALLRWNHPTLGLVSPGQFVPLAESSGQIVAIGNWVFAQAIVQVAAWRQALHPDFQISVNKSPVQFHGHGASSGNWLWQLAELGLPGQSIVVEITEGLLLDASPEVSAQILTLREAGIGISLDDFGTGYSSLHYLQSHDVDFIKIDQSFVRNLNTSAKDLTLCKAMIAMAHALGMKVIAEGVETVMQRDLLLSAGCDYAQGYYFAKPMTADQFTAFLNPPPPPAAHCLSYPMIPAPSFLLNIDAVLFDCDGVLVDSEPITNGVLRDMLAEQGWVLSMEDCMRTFVGKAVKDEAARIEAHTGQPVDEAWLAEFRARRNRGLERDLQAIANIHDAMAAVHAEFGARIACASGADRFKVELQLRKVGLMPYFKGRIFSGHEMPRSKPAPDVYLAAAAALGVPPARCAVVEDTVTGVVAGVAAGCQVLAYAPVGLPGLAGAQALLAAGALQVFTDMVQLPRLLGACQNR